MTKLDWSKAGLRAADPGRVLNIGDYGIMPDRLTGLKGNPKARKKKIKKKAQRPLAVDFSTVPAHQAKTSKPSQVTAAKSKKPNSSQPRGGLTIPELISRAKSKVDRLSAEIRREERKLAGLHEQLKSAELQLKNALDTPRRSPLGKALHEAQRLAANNSAQNKKA